MPLAGRDLCIVTEIYAAREKFDPTIHSIDLVEKLNCAKTGRMVIPNKHAKLAAQMIAR